MIKTNNLTRFLTLILETNVVYMDYAYIELKGGGVLAQW